MQQGCKILNLSNSNIVGTLSSNTKCQLTVLKLSWFAVSDNWGNWPTWTAYTKNIEVLLLSCYSLKHLELQGLCLTPEMAGSICKNGKKTANIKLEPLTNQ